VLEQTWLLGEMSAEDYHRAARLQSVIGETLPAGRELSSDEIHALLGHCAKDPRISGIRDAAVIALMYSGGLRREEVTTLNVEDYDGESGKLIVRGKRSKVRTAYLADGAMAALRDWLAVRGNQPGPLFLAVDKGGNLKYGRRLTPQAIYGLLGRRAEHAGVESFTPHDLRRTFVSDLLEAGVDIATVARMAGHSNVQTTARYDRRPEQVKQKASRLLQVPYLRQEQ
jgi:integrase